MCLLSMLTTLFILSQIQLAHLVKRLIFFINRIDNDGRDLLVAVSFELHAREVAAGRARNQKGKWATYAHLYKKVHLSLL
jgi:hypothetical protein